MASANHRTKPLAAAPGPVRPASPVDPAHTHPAGSLAAAPFGRSARLADNFAAAAADSPAAAGTTAVCWRAVFRSARQHYRAKSS